MNFNIKNAVNTIYKKKKKYLGFSTPVLLSYLLRRSPDDFVSTY